MMLRDFNPSPLTNPSPSFFLFPSPRFVSLPLTFSFSSPPLPVSCSAEISAEAPVRLSGDRDGGCDVASADRRPSAVAMVTPATARRAEAGDESLAGGGEEAGGCVRTLFFYVYFISPFYFHTRPFRYRCSAAEKRIDGSDAHRHVLSHVFFFCCCC